MFIHWGIRGVTIDSIGHSSLGEESSKAHNNWGWRSLKRNSHHSKDQCEKLLAPKQGLIEDAHSLLVGNRTKGCYYPNFRIYIQ